MQQRVVSPLQLPHTLDNLLGLVGDVSDGEVILHLTVVAGRPGELGTHRALEAPLPEVLQQLGTPAVGDVLAVGHHGEQVVHVGALGLVGGALVHVDDSPHALHVAVAVEQDAVGQSSVPACPTCFLGVWGEKKHLKKSFLINLLCSI